jgi:DNA-binding CsgD family transcriptional regulator
MRDRLRCLTPQQRETLGTYCTHPNPKDAAYELFLTPGALFCRLRRIYRRLGVGNRGQACYLLGRYEASRSLVGIGEA